MLPSPEHDLTATLHRILVGERLRPVRDVAAAADISYPAFYARISGRVPFSVDEIRRVLLEVPDIRLADALLAGTRFAAFERAGLTGGPLKHGTIGTALHAMQELSQLVNELAANAEGGTLDVATRARLLDHIREAERSLAVLRHALPRAWRPGEPGEAGAASEHALPPSK